MPKDKQNQQQKLNGGVIINDLKVGDGAVAKPGKNVYIKSFIIFGFYT